MAAIKEKMSSRKWIVFCIWTLISIGAMFLKDMPVELILQNYSFISLAYIGGNTASAYIGSKGKKEGA